MKCNIHLITDTIRDTQNADVHRVRKYFTSKGWLAVLSVLKEKENGDGFVPFVIRSYLQLKIVMLVTDAYYGAIFLVQS